MKNLPILTLVLTAATLSGCGKVAGALIPPQTIENPAGLDGQKLTSSTPLVIESVTGAITYSTRGNKFADTTFPNVPLNIRPHALSFQTGFSSASLGGACVALTTTPTTVVTLKSLSVTASDAVKSATFATPQGAALGTFTLTWNAQNHAYTVSDNVVTVRAGAADTDAFVAVLTSGGDNEATVTATLSADQNTLAGCTFTFTLKNPKVVLSDFS